MSETISFRCEGPFASCENCGANSHMATVGGLCLRCIRLKEEALNPRLICGPCGCPTSLGICTGCVTGTHSFMVCQTKRQRHSNCMLFMRRTMKDIAKVMRVHQVLELERTGVMVSLNTAGHKEMALAYALMAKEKTNG